MRCNRKLRPFLPRLLFELQLILKFNKYRNQQPRRLWPNFIAGQRPNFRRRRRPHRQLRSQSQQRLGRKNGDQRSSRREKRLQPFQARNKGSIGKCLRHGQGRRISGLASFGEFHLTLPGSRDSVGEGLHSIPYNQTRVSVCNSESSVGNHCPGCL